MNVEPGLGGPSHRLPWCRNHVISGHVSRKATVLNRRGRIRYWKVETPNRPKGILMKARRCSMPSLPLGIVFQCCICVLTPLERCTAFPVFMLIREH